MNTDPRLKFMLRSIFVIVGLAAGASAFALSPAELQQKLAGTEKITVIDVRPTAVFQQGHIPGAINVPAALLPDKKLPPLGKVVVCGDGIDSDAAAVARLNQKNGITAESLDGGFAAWEGNVGPTTKPPGLTREQLPTVTYQQLKAMNAANLLLVDLRQPAAASTSSGLALQSTTTEPLTDLQKEFPGAGVTKSPFDLQSRQESGAAAPLLVLIDNGDGVAAQKLARTLQANGVNRVRILAGGEQILSRAGQPGLHRMDLPSAKTNLNLR
jgi:rhodanese-related sulfurtransferase